MPHKLNTLRVLLRGRVCVTALTVIILIALIFIKSSDNPNDLRSPNNVMQVRLHFTSLHTRFFITAQGFFMLLSLYIDPKRNNSCHFRISLFVTQSLITAGTFVSLSQGP